MRYVDQLLINFQNNQHKILYFNVIIGTYSNICVMLFAVFSYVSINS